MVTYQNRTTLLSQGHPHPHPPPVDMGTVWCHSRVCFVPASSTVTSVIPRQQRSLISSVYARQSRMVKCRIRGFHSGDYKEYSLLGYISPVCTSQETHYFSATETIQLMLCKICGFHGGDYEECRLLGYINPVCTSQETHYFSATETIQLMLCKICGFRGGEYEECRLLGYKNQFVPYRRNITSPLQSPVG
jgi:Zn ribbon nucleic-acid-binding protein